MSEEIKPQHLSPWCCPQCGADCSGSAQQMKDLGEATGYYLECACGCRFTHWENMTAVPYGVEVDGVTTPYPDAVRPDVSGLVDEYQDIAADWGDMHLFEEGQEDVAKALVRDHDWTPEGAKQLVELATKYGVFILRNALALAIALKLEDGTEGL